MPQNKIFNNGISLCGVLIPKLLNKPFTSCCFTNIHFLIPQSGHFDCNLPFCFKNLWEFKFSVFFYTSFNKSSCSFIKYISKEKNVLLTALTHTRQFFYQKMFYEPNTFTFSFLFDIKTSIFRCVHSVCFLQFLQCPCFIISFYWF